MYKIIYFNKRIRDTIMKMPQGILGSYLSITDIMEKKGPNLGMPHTRAMGNGLFEIRAKGPEGIGRIFYCTIKRNQIWILHSFIKKTQSTPSKELKIAKKRQSEVNEYE